MTAIFGIFTTPKKLNLVKEKTRTFWAKQIEEDESKEPFPYKDTKDKISIGIGRNLDDRGLSEEEIQFLFKNDLIIAEKDAITYCDQHKKDLFYELSPPRQAVIVNMAFNMGLGDDDGGLLSFKLMGLALAEGDFKRAAKEGMDSKWSVDVGQRATDLMLQLTSGKWPNALMSG